MTELKYPTYQDYMNKKVSYAEYYRAVAATAGIRFINKAIVDRARRELSNGDERLNNIPLKVWDNMGLMIKPQLTSAFIKHGDFFSAAGAVCVLKQIALDEIKGEGIYARSE